MVQIADDATLKMPQTRKPDIMNVRAKNGKIR
jgi:hypothetical protein